MPAITLTLDDHQHRRLADEYKRMSMAWLRDKSDAPPSFETWLAGKVAALESHSLVREIEEIRAVDALERLITTLQTHGFALAQTDRRERDEVAAQLAQALTDALGLAPQRTRRIEELLTYYAKSAREVADAAQVNLTSRSYRALHEALRALTERTTKVIDRLGPERGLGRVEGALTILVMLQVMSRQMAREQSEAFKHQLQERSR